MAGMEGSIDKVCAYLRERGLEEAIIERFRSEKMDMIAVLNASQDNLEELGLIRAGDRLSLVAFSAKEVTNEPGKKKEENKAERKKALLEAFLSKKKRKAPDTNSDAAQEKQKEKIKTKKIQLGWKHFKEEEGTYVLVPLAKGGGSRSVEVPVTIDKGELRQTCKELFFPDGQSLFGKADDMIFDLANFKNEKIRDSIGVGDNVVPFNIGNYMEVYKMKTVRLYLRSRKVCIDPEEDHELEISPFSGQDETPQLSATSLLIGSSEERKMLVEEQDEAYKISLEKDKKKKADIQRKVDKEYWREILQNARKLRVPPEPDSNFVTVRVRHPSLGLQSRRFPTHTLMSSVYDWAGSLSSEPEHFGLHDPLGILLSPSSEVDDRCTLTMIESLEGTPSLSASDDEIEFLGFGQEEPGASGLSGCCTWQDEDELQDFDVICNASEEGIANQQQSQSSRFIRIRRVQVMSDMIEEFKDPTLMEENVKVIMVNGRGQDEAGADEKGVFRDALSAFWRAFENSCTIGEDERIPVLRHDFQAPEWEAIARILVKGYMQLHFLPITLNRAFLIATLFGEGEVSQEILLHSFLAYLSKDEKMLIEKALQGALDDEQEDEWLDFLDRFGCRSIPRPDERRDTILEIAHKEQIQAGQYIIDCWRQPCQSLKTEISSTRELSNIFKTRMPTNKKVIDLLSVGAEAQNNAQRDAFSYLKRYIRGLDDEKLRKVLRFLTGANMICVERIQVTFTNLDGFERRPIAHTCGPSLELPSTYQSFPEFRQEMNSIIDSDFWEMDIA